MENPNHTTLGSNIQKEERLLLKKRVTCKELLIDP